jgi:hypothetical protein
MLPPPHQQQKLLATTPSRINILACDLCDSGSGGLDSNPF